MSKFELIKSVKEYKPKVKPDVDYADFEVMVEGRALSVGIPNRVSDDFEAFLKENDSFTRRQFRKILREFRGVRR